MKWKADLPLGDSPYPNEAYIMLDPSVETSQKPGRELEEEKKCKADLP